MRKTVLTLLLLSFSWVLYAQVAATNLLKQDKLNDRKGQQLKKGWLIQPADFNGWAAAAAPDSAGNWYALDNVSDLAVIRSNIKQFEGLCWLKCYIRADTAIVGVPLSLSAIHNGASNVYLDNRLLSGIGTFSEKHKNGIYISRERPVTFVLNDTGVHELLVKYENKNLAHTGGAVDKNELILKLNTADYTISRLAMTAKQNIFLVITVIFFSFSLFHFILFLFYRKDPSNLFFSLFNLATGVFFMMVYKAIQSSYGGPSSSQDYLKVAIVAIAVSGLTLSGLVNKLFDKFGWRFFTIVSLGAVAVVLMWFTATVAVALIAVTINVTLIEVIFLLLRAYIRKVSGAKILATGILLDFLFLAILIIILAVTGTVLGNNYTFNDNETSSRILLIAIFVIAILVVFCIPVSMSVYLAWKTAYVNKQLSMEVEKVAALSLEKQNILESQKERLEEEVRTRTAELLLQKKKSDDLLLNILPAEVAEELKETGQARAKHFSQASVLFTDFVNFTRISEQLNAEALVAQLDDCFRAFDEIIERNGLEKIKTIGDAYLAASGIPAYNDQHAYKTVKAAIEIIDYIKSRATAQHAFEIRIGINSGPLVAGIVGVKKFAYDIWGDTVNMASRMESSGAPGKINISAATYELVRDKISCTYRGKISAKNKGEVDMYFVDGFTNRNNQ